MKRKELTKILFFLWAYNSSYDDAIPWRSGVSTWYKKRNDPPPKKKNRTNFK